MTQTIAALSTAPGGAIGIVRISGDAAVLSARSSPRSARAIYSPAS